MSFLGSQYLSLLGPLFFTVTVALTMGLAFLAGFELCVVSIHLNFAASGSFTPVLTSSPESYSDCGCSGPNDNADTLSLEILMPPDSNLVCISP